MDYTPSSRSHVTPLIRFSREMADLVISFAVNNPCSPSWGRWVSRYSSPRRGNSDIKICHKTQQLRRGIRRCKYTPQDPISSKRGNQNIFLYPRPSDFMYWRSGSVCHSVAGCCSAIESNELFIHIFEFTYANLGVGPVVFDNVAPGY
jgi:hypothetical protein